MAIFLAIDPGSTKSGYVIWDDSKEVVIEFGKISNISLIRDYPQIAKSYKAQVLLEIPDYISNGAGSTVIDTIFWSGRIFQEFNSVIRYGRKKVQRFFGLKKDKDTISLLKREYPNLKLANDSWQAFLLIHAYKNNLI